MKTTVSAEGQIALPAEILQQDGIQPGQELEIERIDRGRYRLILRATNANEGVVEWLLDCPAKDYFVSMGGRSAP